MLAIEYPTIEVEGRILVVRDSLAAKTLMGRRGINPYNLNDHVGPGKPASAYSWFVIFSCMVAQNFTDQQKPERLDLNLAPTPDYWISKMDNRTDEVVDVCNAAFLKTQEAQKMKLELVPPTEQAS